MLQLYSIHCNCNSTIVHSLFIQKTQILCYTCKSRSRSMSSCNSTLQYLLTQQLCIYATLIFPIKAHERNFGMTFCAMIWRGFHLCFVNLRVRMCANFITKIRRGHNQDLHGHLEPISKRCNNSFNL